MSQDYRDLYRVVMITAPRISGRAFRQEYDYESDLLFEGDAFDGVAQALARDLETIRKSHEFGPLK